MSETNRDADLGRWGRPLRKRSRGGSPQPAAPGAPVVGPVDHDLPPGGAETIVHPRGEEFAPTRAPRDREEPEHEDLSYRREPREPREHHASRERRDPEAVDLSLRDLVVYMARGLVDQPDDVAVEFV